MIDDGALGQRRPRLHAGASTRPRPALTATCTWCQVYITGAKNEVY